MVKKLIQHGNSVALVIDKPIMEKMIIHSLKRVNQKYGAVLKRLGIKKH